ncbi:RrF2 family transcriptional regulator [Bacillus fonticola]|uniref:RrF2 family transcriptional regulator n=1 Tax=Bacillus fonticola TaxID=2728853 RepID=UPI001473EFF2|nr:Rrf2 family transcriptional regulator [Bacillus fonticola]
MRLTQYTDFSLRVLIYLTALSEEERANIQQIADAYNISKNHLMKVVHQLAKLGYVESTRGRGGGIRLNKHPRDINIGEVVRVTEDDFHLVECFDREKNTCVLSPSCRLKGVLYEALQAYLAVLDEYTLEDLTRNRGMLRELLGGLGNEG